MRQKPFPPAHAGENLCGTTLQRTRTATPRSHRKYEQAVWANRTFAAFGDLYVDGARMFPMCKDYHAVRYVFSAGTYPRFSRVGSVCLPARIPDEMFRALPECDPR